MTTLDLLQRLREPMVRSGVLETSALWISWGERGIELWRAPGWRLSEALLLGEEALRSLQLSQSQRQAPQSWWARLFSAPKLQMLLHAELRFGPTSWGPSAEMGPEQKPVIRFSAILPEAFEFLELPQLEVAGELVDFELLLSLLETAAAHGAKLLEWKPSSHERTLGLEAMSVWKLANTYRVGERLLHMPVGQVSRVDERRPHPNADRLELVMVGKRRFVVRKDSLAVGTTVVFLPVGTVLSTDLAARLEIAKYLKSGGKVGEIVLRGERSEGLLLDVENRVSELEKLGATFVGEFVTVGRQSPYPGELRLALVHLGAEGSARLAVAERRRFQTGSEQLLVTNGAELPSSLVEALGVKRFVSRRRVRLATVEGKLPDGVLCGPS